MVALLVIGTALCLMAAGDGSAVYADSRGELEVSRAHARVDDIVTVTVTDADVENTVMNEDEATDFAGNPYALPPGGTGEQEVFRVQNAPLADLDGDGDVDTGDISVSDSTVSVAWVAAETGTFALVRSQTNATPVGFTTTYRHSLVDTVKVRITSPADTTGFELTLKESGAQSSEFTATFSIASESSMTNADDPDASERPAIKASDGHLVNLEYADQSPLTLVTNSVLVDITLPKVTVLAPTHGFATRNVSEYAKAKVTDEGSGVAISDIKFHIDLDRDGVFDEPGETVEASPTLSTTTNKGWEASVLLPTVGTDGAVKWHVTATDRAGNVGISDSDPGKAESHDHSFTVDTKAPRPIGAYLGSAYAGDGKIPEDDPQVPEEERLTNQQGRLRVVFSEDLDPDSIDPARFLIGSGNVAGTGVIHPDYPDTVWLTYESLSSVVKTLTVLPGAVKDVAGFPSEMYFLDPEDQLGPILNVVTDKAVTNGSISVDVTSEEVLGSPPSLTINGVTYSKMIEIHPTTWTLEVDATTLTGAASGQGVKNLQVAGLDEAGNAARGGQSPEAETYPDEAHIFEFDSVIKPPSIVPGHGDVASTSNPVIVVAYANEPEEYAGDTHGSVTIVSAKLDGFDVTSLMTSTTSTSWMYQPKQLSQGEHVFSVQGRDDAGNVHGAVQVLFTVDAPPPTPTPTPEPTPAPTVVATEEPGEEPPDDLQPETSPTPTPTPQPSATAEPTVEGSTTPTPTPSPTVAPGQTGTPEPTATPGGLTEEDIQATVTAMRNGESEEDPEEQKDPTIAADAGYTVFGCGLPAGNATAAVGDYAFVGIGLLGLVAMKGRQIRKRVKNPAESSENDKQAQD